MTKIVINRCFGGFGLSDAALERYAELKGINLVKNTKEKSWGGSSYWIDGIEDREHYFSSHSIDGWENRCDSRSDPILVQVVEEMGKAANGSCADLGIVEIPDDVDWEISEYDGSEHVAEVHRTWS